MKYLRTFAVGFSLVALVAYQTRQLAAGHRGVLVFVVACAISTIWCLGVRAVVREPLAAVFYVLGAGCGTMVAVAMPL